MERVYLLLRNNQQTGPFTIGELMQQHLQPSDMIWIEGKSTAWIYLTELELTRHLEQSEVPAKNTVAKTSDEIERKAEELRKRILSNAPKTYFPQYKTEIETYASPYKMSPEDEIEFVDVRKVRLARKNTVLGELVLTCFVIGLFMLGIYKGKSFLGVRHNVDNVVATELKSHDQHAAQNNRPVAQAKSVTAVNTVDTADTLKQVDSLLTLQKSKQKIAIKRKSFADSNIASVLQPVIGNSIKTEEKTPATDTAALPVKNTAKKDAPVKKETASPAPEIKQDSQSVKPEKKGFLRGLFKRKNKDNSDRDRAKED